MTILVMYRKTTYDAQIETSFEKLKESEKCKIEARRRHFVKFCEINIMLIMSKKTIYQIYIYFQRLLRTFLITYVVIARRLFLQAMSIPTF